MIGAFFTSAASSSKTSSSVTSEPTSATPISTHEAQNQQPTKQSPFVVTNDVVEAEITWCLHTVEEHLSYRLCDSMQALFTVYKFVLSSYVDSKISFSCQNGIE